ncbi:hypothetical protein HK097_004721 [Rhizophlyctis rosea]|uniref:Uncharacterized protein n=1 Tax=Rhizophlyctis rosea TaxID=64517 RepID=A0AAD5SDV8_9FUNG|nr:hypothetical protein HK097_004721 [Rhizophlyctis rosea]
MAMERLADPSLQQDQRAAFRAKPISEESAPNALGVSHSRSMGSLRSNGSGVSAVVRPMTRVYGRTRGRGAGSDDRELGSGFGTKPFRPIDGLENQRATLKMALGRRAGTLLRRTTRDMTGKAAEIPEKRPVVDEVWLAEFMDRMPRRLEDQRVAMRPRVIPKRRALSPKEEEDLLRKSLDEEDDVRAEFVKTAAAKGESLETDAAPSETMPQDAIASNADLGAVPEEVTETDMGSDNARQSIKLGEKGRLSILRPRSDSQASAHSKMSTAFSISLYQQAIPEEDEEDEAEEKEEAMGEGAKLVKASEDVTEAEEPKAESTMPCDSVQEMVEVRKAEANRASSDSGTTITSSVPSGTMSSVASETSTSHILKSSPSKSTAPARTAEYYTPSNLRTTLFPESLIRSTTSLESGKTTPSPSYSFLSTPYTGFQSYSPRTSESSEVGSLATLSQVVEKFKSPEVVPCEYVPETAVNEEKGGMGTAERKKRGFSFRKMLKRVRGGEKEHEAEVGR